MRVRIRLERDEDGWPPVDSEGLLAVPRAGGGYELANSPWFAWGLAAGDVVSAVPDAAGTLWVAGVVEEASNCCVRLAVLPDGALRGDLRAAMAEFEPLGVHGEGLDQFGMIALTVPADVDVAAVKRLVVRGAAEGWWDYEESSTTEEWDAPVG